MERRIALIPLILAGLALIAGGYFYLKRSMIITVEPYEAVAADAVMAGRVVNIAEFLSLSSQGGDMWSELETVLGLSGFNRSATFLDSLLKTEPVLSSVTGGSSLYFSLHPTGRSRYGMVWYLEIASARSARSANEMILQMMEANSPVSTRLYNRSRVYEGSYGIDDLRKELSWTMVNGLLILSHSPLLVERAIDQAGKSDGIFDDEAFRRIYGTAGGGVDANIFVNLELLPRYISAYSDGTAHELLSGFPKLANWAALDLHLRDDALLVNGFSFSSEREFNYLDVFEGQQPVGFSAESVIPSFASAFVALGLPDQERFFNRHTSWLEATGRKEEFDKLRQSFLRVTGEDPHSVFNSFSDGETVMVLTGWDDPAQPGETFLVLNTRSRSYAVDRMRDMLTHNSALTGSNINSYREIYRIDNEISYELFRWPFEETGRLLYGEVFGTAATSWYTFVDNYLVFADSREGLESFIRANILNQTLDSDIRFREYSEYLVSRNNFWFYSNVSRSAGLFTSLLHEPLSDNITTNSSSFRKFQAMSLQFSTGRDMIYNNMFLKYSPTVTEEAHTEWQTLLDTLADFKPVLVTNHNTGAQEIFVQDLNNNIYLVNAAGRILWKKPLPGRIMGNVYQIDYFNNNRLQLMFNTREQIYLLDRNGNDVGRYPVRLPSPATNGISVFDYDNNKDYRIFVASEDRSVTVRSKEGNIITGWTFGRSEHNVYHHIQYFRSAGRDFIVFADRNRVYILDRRGNTRVRPDRVFPVSTHNEIVFEGRTPGSDARLTITDTLGLVWHIYLDGRTETRKLGEFSSGHFFDFQDMNADGYRDYIFLDNNRLSVYDHNGSLMFNREFPVNISRPPAYYYFSRTDRKVGVVSHDAEQIFLINSSGELYNGFPLQGRSLFTIGFLERRDGVFNLIVGAGNNFLYNYNVY